MARQHERTSARKCAAQILYSGAIRAVPALVLLDRGEIDCLERPVSDYAYGLVEGVNAHRSEIDSILQSASENWKLDRMAIMDLAILRLAIYEMMYVDKVPISVSINEAVELAKNFGGEEDSHKFVNGILGRIARQLEGAKSEVSSDDR